LVGPDAAIRVGGPPVGPSSRGEMAMGVLMQKGTEGELLDLILALRPAGGLAGRLHGGKEQGHEHTDDGNHHQQLDQGKTRSYGEQFPHGRVPLGNGDVRQGGRYLDSRLNERSRRSSVSSMT